jgi:hypothetical protein
MRAAEVLHGAPVSTTDLARARLKSGAEAVPPPPTTMTSNAFLPYRHTPPHSLRQVGRI